MTDITDAPATQRTSTRRSKAMPMPTHKAMLFWFGASSVVWAGIVLVGYWLI